MDCYCPRLILRRTLSPISLFSCSLICEIVVTRGVKVHTASETFELGANPLKRGTDPVTPSVASGSRTLLAYNTTSDHATRAFFKRLYIARVGSTSSVCIKNGSSQRGRLHQIQNDAKNRRRDVFSLDKRRRATCQLSLLRWWERNEEEVPDHHRMEQRHEIRRPPPPGSPCARPPPGGDAADGGIFNPLLSTWRFGKQTKAHIYGFVWWTVKIGYCCGNRQLWLFQRKLIFTSVFGHVQKWLSQWHINLNHKISMKSCSQDIFVIGCWPEGYDDDTYDSAPAG